MIRKKLRPSTCTAPGVIKHDAKPTSTAEMPSDVKLV